MTGIRNAWHWPECAVTRAAVTGIAMLPVRCALLLGNVVADLV